MEQKPWVTFCMSTYKRPGYLKEQIDSLLKQTFPHFEIVVSDNDPDGSGEQIIVQAGDSRVRYYKNGVNLGMIRSFNSSIDRAVTPYVVLVTDDDPVFHEFLSDMYKVYTDHPGYALYGGFTRASKPNGNKEIIPSGRFISEILDPAKTPWLLWSSCVIRKDELIRINKIPDYGSPHLADHAMIALAGSLGGGVIINKKYSSLTSHENNFSKFNFEYYVNGCNGFYNELKEFCEEQNISQGSMNVVRKHLYHWFLANMFTIKRYYTVSVPDPGLIKEINLCAARILKFKFMRNISMRYKIKNLIFIIKKETGLLRKK